MPNYRVYDAPPRPMSIRDLGDGGAVAQILMENARRQTEIGQQDAEGWQNALAGVTGAAEGYFKRRDDKKVQGAITAAMGGGGGGAPVPVKTGPGFDVNGDPTEDPTILDRPRMRGEGPGRAGAAMGGAPDVQAILAGLRPELRGRAMQGIQQFQDFAAKGQKSRMELAELQQKMDLAKKTQDQHDRDTVAVGAFNALQWHDQPDGGLGADTLLFHQAKAAGIDTSRFEKFLQGAQEHFAQVQDDPAAMEGFRRAYLEQRTPLLQQLTLGGSAEAQKGFKPETTTMKTRDAAGNETEEIVPKTVGVKRTSAPEPAKPGTFEDYVTKKYGRAATPDQIAEARKVYGQADDRIRVSVGGASDADVKDVVAGMKAGTLPPQLPGRASKEYVALLAEAKRQGYDLASAATDWAATQKHIATLNGAQQTRMAQAIDNAYDSLDVIDNLSKEWAGGRFPALNKAQLFAAKQGALGPKAQAIATKLDAQISDLTSEMGNVYMGGNSPTDHALSLASKNLSSDWSDATLREMTKLARTNLSIRRNSMRNVGVAGASEGNPYVPKHEEPASPAAPKVGDKKTFPNGRVGVFDGKGYVAQ